MDAHPLITARSSIESKYLLLLDTKDYRAKVIKTMLDYDSKISLNKSHGHYKIPPLRPCSNLFKLYSSLIAVEGGGGCIKQMSTKRGEPILVKSGWEKFLSLKIVGMRRQSGVCEQMRIIFTSVA